MHTETYTQKQTDTQALIYTCTHICRYVHKPTTVSLLELATKFKMLNGSDLGSLYKGEFGKEQRGYTGEFEIYSTNSPIGQQYQGYITNRNSGEITECNISS